MTISLRKRTKSALNTVKFPIAAAAISAISIAILFCVLALLLFLVQCGVDFFGYRILISDEMQRAFLTIGGALGVALVALHGVRSQNISAENRHRIDSNLALKKDIFLQVAEAYSSQFQFVLTLSDPTISEIDRKDLIRNSGKAFFKLQFVAKQETIVAMIEANQEWARAMIDIRLMGAIQADAPSRFERLIQIQMRITPYMQKLWRFNILAREEIGDTFPEPELYFETMTDKFGELADFLSEVKQRIPHA